MRLKLSQPSLAGVWAGAELGNKLDKYIEHLVPNSFWSTNIFGSKENQAIKFLGQKILSPKIFQVKNYLGLTKIESEKFRV